MTTVEILKMLQRDIHSAVFATVDENGLPQTCVIDLMLADEGGLYFLTARGKAFYRRLTAAGFVALSGMKGVGTLSTVAVSYTHLKKAAASKKDMRLKYEITGFDPFIPYQFEQTEKQNHVYRDRCRGWNLCHRFDDQPWDRRKQTK